MQVQKSVEKFDDSNSLEEREVEVREERQTKSKNAEHFEVKRDALIRKEHLVLMAASCLRNNC